VSIAEQQCNAQQVFRRGLPGDAGLV